MPNSRRIVIEIYSCEKSAEDLREDLERHIPARSGVLEFILRDSDSRCRTIEPSALLAVISGGSAALGALITAILKISLLGRYRKIVIQGKTGARVEFPADTSTERINELVDKVKEMDEPRIYL